MIVKNTYLLRLPVFSRHQTVSRSETGDLDSRNQHQRQKGPKKGYERRTGCDGFLILTISNHELGGLTASVRGGDHAPLTGELGMSRGVGPRPRHAWASLDR